MVCRYGILFYELGVRIPRDCRYRENIPGRIFGYRPGLEGGKMVGTSNQNWNSIWNDSGEG